LRSYAGELLTECSGQRLGHRHQLVRVVGPSVHRALRCDDDISSLPDRCENQLVKSLEVRVLVGGGMKLGNGDKRWHLLIPSVSAGPY
jgi:hypothetical protein